MPRIAKNDVNSALDRAAKNITDAAGRDGVTSRKDIKKALESIASPTEKALTDRFFRFMDHRDFKTGARITAPDVQRAVDYSKEHLLANYDVNHNGFSKAEIAKMSVTGQLTVRLAAELKGITLPDVVTPTTDLGRAITDAAKGADFISESDSTPAFVSASFAKTKAITGDAVMTAFADPLKKAFAFDATPVDLTKFTFEQLSDHDAKAFLPDLADAGGSTDQFEIDNAAAFGKLNTVINANLTDLVAFRIGPKDDQDPTKMGSDQGAYQYLILGRTNDNKLAGVMFESVET